MLTADQKRYEWALVALMFCVWGTLFLDRMSLLYLAPYIAPDLHLSNQDIGVLAAVISVTWAISSAIFGMVSDKVGRRKVLIPMIFIFSAMSCLSGLAQNFHQLLLTRAIMGIAEGPCWSVLSVIVVRSSSAATRDRNTSIVVSAAALAGLALAPVLTTQVAAHYGWRIAFCIAGVPGFVLGFIAWAFVKEPPAVVEGDVPDEDIHSGNLLDVLRNRNVLLCCLASTGMITWLMLQNAFAPLYITQVMGKPGTEEGFLLGAAGLGSFCIVALVPALLRRFSRRGTLGLFGALSFFLPVALLTPALYNMPWLLAAILFLTQGGQPITSLAVVLIPSSSVPPRLAGTAVGLCNMVGEIFGSTLSPIVAGALIPKFGLAFPLQMGAVAILLVVVAAIFIREKKTVSVGQTVTA
ncbi:MFS transporter [Acidocella sp.]|uniref:MFS transporter n=1 Tax=Acidocella sp. TaxID=50710 RepID=UPI003D0166C3